MLPDATRSSAPCYTPCGRPVPPRAAPDRRPRRPGSGWDPDEAEIGVVGAGGVEVDRADAQDPLAEALVGVDVLDAVDAGLLDLLGRIPRRM